jgi:nicotinamidase-related amidase
MKNNNKIIGPTAPHRDSRRGGVGLVIIDMINRFDFPGAERLKPKAETASRAISRLKADVRRLGAPVIYVNDNFGEWHSEKSLLVERALESGNLATHGLVPAKDDFFIIKPQFSGFYATNLPVLLPKLGVSRLIMSGVATDICVLFTAADAHMRDYALWVPSDAVAAADEQGKWALEIMRSSMGAETATTEDLTVSQWISALDAAGIR